MRQYELALGNKVEALIKEVERLYALGYVPQGGIAVSEAYGRLGQAMVLPAKSVATVRIDPAEVAVSPQGGNGSSDVTVLAPGTWQVDATSVPDWVTVTPMDQQTADGTIVYTAASNMTGVHRIAVIRINAATLTIDQ